jgi:hypothetical protein
MHRAAAVQEERGKWLIPAIVAALLVAALGLLLAGGKSGQAATEEQQQGIGASILSSLTWNPDACLDAVAMADVQFNNLSPGDTDTTLVPSVACVSSNSQWDVTSTIEATDEPTTGTADLPGSAFSIQTLDLTAAANILEADLSILDGLADPLIAGGTKPCTASACGLGSVQTIIDNAPANALTLSPLGGIDLLGGLFLYNYSIDVPDDQPAGNYTGGAVTFTATN